MIIAILITLIAGLAVFSYRERNLRKYFEELFETYSDQRNQLVEKLKTANVELTKVNRKYYRANNDLYQTRLELKALQMNRDSREIEKGFAERNGKSIPQGF